MQKQDTLHKAILFMPWLLVFVMFLFGSTGCSVYMAAKQPKERDLSVLTVGTSRGHVIAELGAPMWSGERDGNKVDIFTFVQGYSTGARSARALFHGVSDVFTLGLWEVIGTPVEGAFSGSEMKIEIAYDEKERVRQAKNIGGESQEQKISTSETQNEKPVSSPSQTGG